MRIESDDLKRSLIRLMDGTEDIIGRAFDRGIQTSISMVEILEDFECRAMAQTLEGRNERDGVKDKENK